MEMEKDVIQLPGEPNSAHVSRIVVVMRHGERRDGAPDAPPEVDPPLTNNGIAQIAKAAEVLRNVLGVKRARKMLLLVSPFLRTIQTAQELQRCGIGIASPLIIDNTICEVYGPTRIKSGRPPIFSERVMKGASGELPLWGESIEMASRRFVNSLHNNSFLYPDRHLLFVTHGDAIGAILSAFYPMRTVYEVEYLSFIALRKCNSNASAVDTDFYELVGSNGVYWLLDGPENSIKESSVLEVDSVSGSGDSKSSNIDGTPQENGVSLSGYSRSDFGHNTVSEDNLTPVTTQSMEIDNDIDCMDIFFFLLAMISQFLVFFTWSNKVDATIYVTIVIVVELFDCVRKVLVSQFPHLPLLSISLDPFFRVSEYRRVLLENTSQYPYLVDILPKLGAIALKVFFIFFFSVMFALVNTLQVQRFSMLHSYITFFTTVPNALIYLSYWIFNVLRALREDVHS
ncbi:uncharacterized protein TM35_000043590 [Trypanosoma theileri]|uniref:Uncharacterized protein n=1 Tax=Trypanosoma theileri TaxID=67003 RepID=A0A1X0P5I5_9TRYP|nr:uncharacterized protein TM35_000043590 [Trypanosoma theileri]ORC92145.1 hypothetical protein TM35_000043590 [Trypanosoma theileri]